MPRCRPTTRPGPPNQVTTRSMWRSVRSGDRFLAGFQYVALPRKNFVNRANRSAPWSRKCSVIGTTDRGEPSGNHISRKRLRSGQAAGVRSSSPTGKQAPAGRNRPRPEPSGRGLHGSPGDVGRCWPSGTPGPRLVKAMARNGQLHRLVIGTEGGSGTLAMTDARRNLLILGPPRSDKTAGVLTLSILAHPGPGRVDVDQGRCAAGHGAWCELASAGSGTTAQTAVRPRRGASELRWSPIPPSAKWSSAIALGKAMADVSEQAAAARTRPTSAPRPG